MAAPTLQEGNQAPRRTLASFQPTGELHGQYAGFTSRGLGLAIDLALTTVVSLTTYWMIGAVLALLGIQLDSCVSLVPVTDLQSLLHNTCRLIRISEYVFSLLLPLVYFFIFWVLGGQTVGMGIAGVRVISTSGGRVTGRTALLRLVGYALSILALGLGFIWCLFDERRQGWHDKLAGTYVVYWQRSRMPSGKP